MGHFEAIEIFSVESLVMLEIASGCLEKLTQKFFSLARNWFFVAEGKEKGVRRQRYAESARPAQ